MAAEREGEVATWRLIAIIAVGVGWMIVGVLRWPGGEKLGIAYFILGGFSLFNGGVLLGVRLRGSPDSSLLHRLFLGRGRSRE